MKKGIKYLLLISAFFLGINTMYADTTHSIPANEISRNTYVIGNHLFDRNTNDSYNGQLTTRLIMLASKTIAGYDVDDMIIYYKNARGVWIDGISGESITPPQSFEIVYIDTKSMISTPILRDDGAISCVDIPQGKTCYDVYPKFPLNGSFLYDLAIDNSQGYNWEIYEKNGSNINLTPIASASEGEVVLTAEVEVGTTKTIVARSYITSASGTKLYSNFSNDITLTPEIPAPTLSIGSGALGLAGFTISLEGVYESSSSTANLEQITGWELYEKIDNEYQKVGENTDFHSIEMTVDVGETRRFVAVAYDLNSKGERVRSEYSNELTLSYDIPNPTLTAIANNDGSTELTITAEGQYEPANVTSAFANWRWELYEVNNNTYTKVGENGNFQSMSVEVPLGETKRYVAKVYALNSHNVKIYSNNSNEVTIKNDLPVPTLSIETKEIIEEQNRYQLTIYSEGEYAGTPLTEEIAGWELYEVIGDTKTPVDGQTVSLDYGEIKTLVARTYILNSNNQKVYSDYSEELIVSYGPYEPTLSVASTSANSANLTIFTEGTYTEEEELEKITGWELYESNNNEYTKVGENTNLESISIELEENETKHYVAKTYILNSNNQKVYSDYSNEITLTYDNEISTIYGAPTPTLTATGIEETNDAFVSINDEGVYAESHNLIDGWELYEIIDNKYYYVTEADDNMSIRVTTMPEEIRTFVARTYTINNNNLKVYSDYSNKITINRISLPTVSYEEFNNDSANFTIFSEGTYADNHDSIDGWELYLKDNNTYTKIGENDNFTSIHVTLEPGQHEYVARVYKLSSNNEKKYSDYSSSVSLMRMIYSPTLRTESYDDFNWDNDILNVVIHSTSANLTITEAGMYHDTQHSIQGWEVYKVIDDEYTKVGENTNFDPISIELEPDQAQRYAARVYVLNHNNEKVYSDYSSQIVISNSN